MSLTGVKTWGLPVCDAVEDSGLPVDHWRGSPLLSATLWKTVGCRWMPISVTTREYGSLYTIHTPYYHYCKILNN